MRKLMTSAMAAVIAVGAVLATAGPANADRRHYRHNDRNNDQVAAAIIGGVAGLALGAALAGGDRRPRDDYRYDGYSYDPRYDRYSGGYYGGGYYRGGYAPAPRYRTCIVRDRVYDPYIGRRVMVERRYPC